LKGGVEGLLRISRKEDPSMLNAHSDLFLVQTE
jgi:hypothetical protein